MLSDFIEANSLKAEIIECRQEVDTVEQACKETGSPAENIAKSLLLIHSEKKPLKKAVLVVCRGNNRIDFGKLKALLGIQEIRLATPKEILEITGYDIGGVPPISIFGVRTIIDKQLLEKDFVFCGGGDNKHLLKISPQEILENAFEASAEDIAQ